MTPASEANKAAKARYRRRASLLNFARDIARSGRHADHTGVIRELEAMEGILEGLSAARARLEDPAFRMQLNRLCAKARFWRCDLTSPALRGGMAKVGSAESGIGD